MSTAAEAFANQWPLETVPIGVEELVIGDQIVVEFDKVAKSGSATLTGRVVEHWFGSVTAIVFEDSAGYRWRANETGAVIRVHNDIAIGESASIEAVREVIPDGGREIRKRLPCDGDCSGRTRHVHLGPNSVGRDIWRCLECGEKRSGPILAKSDAVPVATDGGR